MKLGIPDGVVFEILEDEAVLLELKSGLYFSLNEAGTTAWRLIAQHGDLQKVKEEMLEQYGVEGELLQRDLAGLVEQLVAKGLLVRREPE